MSNLAVKRRSGSEMTQSVSGVLTGMAQPLAQLLDVISCLRAELNKDLPIQHIALLLEVVQQPGISMQDLMDRLGMPQGSVSRNVKLLTSPGRGYGLLRNEQDLINRKQVVVFPTDKCIDLVEKLCRLMQTDEQEDQVHICQCAGAN